jgi:hypothetical protein
VNEQEVASPAATVAPPAETEEPADLPRNAIAEWVVIILVLLFGTTSLVQAFVIPT